MLVVGGMQRISGYQLKDTQSDAEKLQLDLLNAKEWRLSRH